MNGRLAARRIEAASQRLAANGYDLSHSDFVQCGNSTQQALHELGRVQRTEDGVEVIVQRNACAQIEKLR